MDGWLLHVMGEPAFSINRRGFVCFRTLVVALFPPDWRLWQNWSAIYIFLYYF